MMKKLLTIAFVVLVAAAWTHGNPSGGGGGGAFLLADFGSLGHLLDGTGGKLIP